MKCIALLCIVFPAAAFTSNALHRANGFAAERICKRATARACTYGCVMHLEDHEHSLSRRDAVHSAVKAVGLSALAIGLSPKPASAGLLLSPPTRLNNRYFLVRAGQSFADAAGQVQSHPIYKLHMSNGLTELGRKQAERAAASLKSLGAGVDGPGVIIWHDISSRALETANVLCEQLGIGRERVIPEYAFLEPRGMGLWESGNVTVILPALYRADAQNSLWRPPANDDGTPHESVQDVLVRVRQLMSKLETQYSGEDIVLVSPDSDCLSILQAFVLGEDFFGLHSKFFIRSGEVRPLLLSESTATRYTPVRYAKVKLDGSKQLTKKQQQQQQQQEQQQEQQQALPQ
eukprot:14959-Heterococcus_DN1.PRE.2